MNLQESQYVLNVLEAAFPSFYKDVKQESLLHIIKLWQDMFKEESCEVVLSAVKALIATKIDSFPPTIGAVKEQIVKLTQPEQMTEMEAWSLVEKACRNGSHGAVKEFNKLPDVIQRAIGSADQLRVWAQMDEETVNSVIASNFMRSFKVKQQNQKELDMLPGDIRSMLNSTSEKMKLSSEKVGQIRGNTDQVKMLNAISQEEVIQKPVDVSVREPYKVPDDAEWERMREKALSSLGV